MCRPEVVHSPVPFLDVRNGRHPCVSRTYSGDDFIPNDVVINGGRSQDGSLVVVVMGPNMGGKSTLMRQTGLIVILAQLVSGWLYLWEVEEGGREGDGVRGRERDRRRGRET